MEDNNEQKQRDYSKLKNLTSKPDPDLQQRVLRAREQEKRLQEEIAKKKSLGLHGGSKAIVSKGVFKEAMVLFNNILIDWFSFEKYGFVNEIETSINYEYENNFIL